VPRTLLQYGGDPRRQAATQSGAGKSTVVIVIRFIVLLLVIWLALAILGFVIKGLFWLAVIGIVFFVVTAIIGYIRRGGSRSKV
jgi:hypothetical protein